MKFTLSMVLAMAAVLAADARPARAAVGYHGLEAQRPGPPARAPSAGQVDRAIRRGVDFLLADQNPDGSWGSARRTKDLNVFAPVPGSHHSFRMACTALAVRALLHSGDRRPQTLQAIDRAERYIFDQLDRIRRPDPSAIYNVWAHAYAITALADLYDRRPDDAARRRHILELVGSQVQRLGRYAKVRGGWSYYEFGDHFQQPSGMIMSFTTATVLIALNRAEQLGVDVPDRLVAGGLRALERCRLPDGAFLYADTHWWRPRRPINRLTGSLGRSQVCLLALRLWGQPVEQAMLTRWLDLLFARIGWLDMARKKPIPHESFAANSGYFFFYGLYYASRCIAQLPAERRRDYYDKLNNVLLPLQEKDGSWWDYPLYNYHQQYGTAYALLCLARSRPPAAPAPAATSVRDGHDKPAR